MLKKNDIWFISISLKSMILLIMILNFPTLSVFLVVKFQLLYLDWRKMEKYLWHSPTFIFMFEEYLVVYILISLNSMSLSILILNSPYWVKFLIFYKFWEIFFYKCIHIGDKRDIYLWVSSKYKQLFNLNLKFPTMYSPCILDRFVELFLDVFQA